MQVKVRRSNASLEQWAAAQVDVDNASSWSAKHNICLSRAMPWWMWHNAKLLCRAWAWWIGSLHKSAARNCCNSLQNTSKYVKPIYAHIWHYEGMAEWFPHRDPLDFTAMIQPHHQVCRAEEMQSLMSSWPQKFAPGLTSSDESFIDTEKPFKLT